VPTKKHFDLLVLNYGKFFREVTGKDLFLMTWRIALYACIVHNMFSLEKILLCWVLVWLWGVSLVTLS